MTDSVLDLSITTNTEDDMTRTNAMNQHTEHTPQKKCLRSN